MLQERLYRVPMHDADELRKRLVATWAGFQQSMLQEHMYEYTNPQYRRVDELRKRLVATWAEFQHSMVDYAFDQWRKRLEACIRAEGSHFEHLLFMTLLA